MRSDSCSDPIGAHHRAPLGPAVGQVPAAKVVRSLTTLAVLLLVAIAMLMTGMATMMMEADAVVVFALSRKNESAEFPVGGGGGR